MNSKLPFPQEWLPPSHSRENPLGLPIDESLERHISILPDGRESEETSIYKRTQADAGGKLSETIDLVVRKNTGCGCPKTAGTWTCEIKEHCKEGTDEFCPNHVVYCSHCRRKVCHLDWIEQWKETYRYFYCPDCDIKASSFFKRQWKKLKRYLKRRKRASGKSK